MNHSKQSIKILQPLLGGKNLLYYFLGTHRVSMKSIHFLSIKIYWILWPPKLYGVDSLPPPFMFCRNFKEPCHNLKFLKANIKCISASRPSCYVKSDAAFELAEVMHSSPSVSWALIKPKDTQAKHCILLLCLLLFPPLPSHLHLLNLRCGTL